MCPKPKLPKPGDPPPTLLTRRDFDSNNASASRRRRSDVRTDMGGTQQYQGLMIQ